MIDWQGNQLNHLNMMVEWQANQLNHLKLMIYWQANKPHKPKVGGGGEISRAEQ